MGERNNHKTMRIGDEALAYIETFAGVTFNDRVNNMIDYFINTQKTYEADLRFQENQIIKKKEILQQLKKDLINIKSEISRISQNYNDLLR